MDSLEGSGTKEGPYKIRTIEHLNMIKDFYGCHYELVNDIDCEEDSHTLDYAPIGEDEVFDGNGYTISNLCLKNNVNSEKIGLFNMNEGVIRNVNMENITLNHKDCPGSGCLVGISKAGRVENCLVKNSKVTGTICGGGLVGRGIDHSIVNSGFEGFVKGDEKIGGIIGRSIDGYITNCMSSCNLDCIKSAGGIAATSTGGEIVDCVVDCDISGGHLIGGIIASSMSEIRNCFSSGHIEGVRRVGGLVGMNTDILESSFSKVSMSCNPNISDPQLGGLVGKNSGHISECVFDGSFSSSRVGSLVGDNQNVICNTYSLFENNYDLVHNDEYGTVKNCDFQDNMEDVKCSIVSNKL